MNKFNFFCSILSCLLFEVSFSYGQTAKADSTFMEKSATHFINLYREAIGEQSGVYNGQEYIPLNFYVTGHPYFESDVVEEGSVFYDGVLYDHVPIIFDLLKDEVIIEHYNGVYNIQLHKERVKHFSLLAHNFIRIEQDSVQNSVIRTGFYDMLYEGKVKVLAKRTKIIQEAPGKTTKKFLQKNYYFVQKNGEYYVIKNKSSMLRVFNDQKKPLQKFIRDNKLNFKENYENAVVQLVGFYDKF